MPHKTLEFDITPDCSGARLDRCLSRLIPGSSRAYLQKLIKDGLVQNSAGSSLTLPRYPVKSGEHIIVTMPEIEDTTVKAEDFDYPILFEDEHMLVIAKPAGVVVHPAAGNPDGTIVNALLGRYPGFGDRFQNVNGRPGIVHRLDKDTSGCLVVAKTPDALFKLGTAFAEHTTQKTYLALVRGVPKKLSDEIVNLIGRHPVNRQKMAVVERNGKMAISLYRTKKSGTLDGNTVSLMEVDIKTGRTHQIRVHLSSIGIPVLGDQVYGGSRTNIEGADRQMLHAWRISLPHPATGERMTFEAPIPEDMQTLIDRTLWENENLLK
ncbi:MAG: RluA family pseudouridine synthase [Lentisphaerae bacterium]|nr:RluA family pseudouridine synthase [Lentisphaerota bacterium]